MEKLVIGVLGGMGTFATINMFKQYASVFKAEKEWERPPSTETEEPPRHLCHRKRTS